MVSPEVGKRLLAGSQPLAGLEPPPPRGGVGSALRKARLAIGEHPPKTQCAQQQTPQSGTARDGWWRNRRQKNTGQGDKMVRRGEKNRCGGKQNKFVCKIPSDKNSAWIATSILIRLRDLNLHRRKETATSSAIS